MSNEELAMYLKENPEDKARQELLYFQVVNYVKKYINRFFPAADKEDLLQESYFALMKTVSMYNPDKGSFLNYFTCVITYHAIYTRPMVECVPCLTN